MRPRGRFPSGGPVSVYDRAKILKKTAELMRNRADRIARILTLEQGKPLTEAKTEILHSADTFEWFAEEGKRPYGRIIPPANIAKRYYAIKHPVGVVGTITPWNFPAALPCRKIAPALAAGCTVVSRPAEQTPLTLIQMFECLADAGVPPGVANLVIGPSRAIADGFFEHPAVRKISFTGSTEVGKELIRRSADQVKRLSLELGGHAPLIVFPDADIEQVAQAAVIGKFRNNGQVCIAPSRFYLHEKIAKGFTEAAVELTRKLKVGNGLEAGVQVGPMFEAKALAKTAELVEDARGKGAKILTGGAVDAVLQGLLVRADGGPRGQRRDAAHDRGAVCTRHALARFLEARRRDRRRQQHAVWPGGLCLHQRPHDRDSHGRGARGGHHRHQRPRPRDPAVPVRRHEGIGHGPRAGNRGAGRLPGNQVRLGRAAAGLIGRRSSVEHRQSQLFLLLLLFFEVGLERPGFLVEAFDFLEEGLDHLSSLTWRIGTPLLKMIPLPAPAAMPRSASLASPKPLTRQPRMLIRSGFFMFFILSSTSATIRSRSMSSRPQVGQATTSGLVTRRSQARRMSKPAAISGTGSPRSDTRIVSPMPRSTIAPMPAALLSVPYSREPASVIPTWVG